jgi:hypothetical protein
MTLSRPHWSKPPSYDSFAYRVSVMNCGNARGCVQRVVAKPVMRLRLQGIAPRTSGAQPGNRIGTDQVSARYVNCRSTILLRLNRAR